MNDSPEEIRRDIERTRAELSQNVTALGDSSRPSNLAREQVDKVKEGVAGLKEKVFGDPYDPWDEGAVGSAGRQVADARDRAGDLAADAPRQLKARTRGNPLAAGLIAFGVGALVGGLLPASRVEQEAAARVKDAAEPVVEQVKEMAQEASENLKPTAQDAAESVRTTAQDAGQTVRDEASRARDDVSSQASSSARTVRDEAREGGAN